MHLQTYNHIQKKLLKKPIISLQLIYITNQNKYLLTFINKNVRMYLKNMNTIRMTKLR